jgi:hypothetical protein
LIHTSSLENAICGISNESDRVRSILPMEQWTTEHILLASRRRALVPSHLKSSSQAEATSVLSPESLVDKEASQSVGVYL